MAIGVLFGVLAGIPTALMVIASAQRRSREDDGAASARRVTAQPVVPIIVLTPQSLDHGSMAQRLTQVETMPAHVRYQVIEDEWGQVWEYDTVTHQSRRLLVDTTAQHQISKRQVR